MLTYRNFMSDAEACIEMARLRRKHVFLAVLPMFHAFGMTTAMVAPTCLGAPIVCLGRFSPVAALEAIRKNDVSVLFAVPSILATLVQAKSARPEDFRAMEYIISGGEPLPPRLLNAFQQRFGKTIYEGYGLTETSPVLCLNTPEACRPGSVGQGIPGTEFRVVDESGRPVFQGEIGEILIRGPMVMKGYHNLPEATAEVLGDDGFFRTGDLGRIDADGFLFVTGRKKDMIIVSGEKVYPREIEDLLTRHPDVAEAAVVGVKSDTRGEMIVAYIRSRDGAASKPDELRAFCLKSGIPAWKCPRAFRVVESFPRSPTGKVLKRELQAMFVDGGEA